MAKVELPSQVTTNNGGIHRPFQFAIFSFGELATDNFKVEYLDNVKYTARLIDRTEEVLDSGETIIDSIVRNEKVIGFDIEMQAKVLNTELRAKLEGSTYTYGDNAIEGPPATPATEDYETIEFPAYGTSVDFDSFTLYISREYRRASDQALGYSYYEFPNCIGAFIEEEITKDGFTILNLKISNTGVNGSKPLTITNFMPTVVE